LGGKYATSGPGPAQYNVTGMRAKGRDYPRAATLQSRPKELTRFSNPGPGEYDVVPAAKAVIDATPKYTFGQRPAALKTFQIPGEFQTFSSWCLNGVLDLDFGVGFEFEFEVEFGVEFGVFRAAVVVACADQGNHQSIMEHHCI